MQKRARLTNELLGAMKNETGRPTWVYDTDWPGFCVSCSPRGKRVFYQLGKVEGATTRVKIGAFPAMTVQDARRRAKEIAGAMAGGADPRPAPVKRVLTFGELFRLFMDMHSVPKKRTHYLDQNEYDAHLTDWASRPIDSIEREDVADKVSGIVTNPKHGRGPGHKVRALISSVYSFAIQQGKAKYNPVAGTYRPTFEPRERYLTASEMKTFFAIVEAWPRPITRDFLMMAVWTGARRSNVASMEWDEINWKERTWTIARSKYKGKRQHVVPLVPDAISLLKSIRSAQKEDERYVFPGPGKSGHFVEPKGAMKKIREKIPGIRLHDVRRTLGAWQSQANVNLKTIQFSMGHADIRTTAQSYTPTELSAVRAAVTDYAGMVRRARKSKG